MKFVIIFLAVTQFLVFLGFMTNVAVWYPTCATKQYPPNRPPVAWYTIDLDQPPELRWRDILAVKGSVLKSMMAKVKTFIREVAFNSSIPVELLDLLMPELGKELSSPLKEEIQGIAKYSNVSYGEVVLYNLFYDLNPLCTSIVAQAPNGTLYHARNLDYGAFSYKNITVNMTEELREGVMNLRYMKGGKVSFFSTSYVGYAGVLTGMKPDVLTLTFNARHPDIGNWDRYLEMLEWILGLKPLEWVAPLTRDIMENATSATSSVVALRNYKMIAPIYFILGGTLPGEGWIITKGSDVEDVYRMDANQGRWYVLQTNYDHWLPTPTSDPRRDDAMNCMNKTGQQALSFSTLYDVLSTRPVLATDTTYTTLMQVGGRYESYVRYPDSPVP